LTSTALQLKHHYTSFWDPDLKEGEINCADLRYRELRKKLCIVVEVFTAAAWPYFSMVAEVALFVNWLIFICTENLSK
jgi:hypothetical protein